MEESEQMDKAEEEKPEIENTSEYRRFKKLL